VNTTSITRKIQTDIKPLRIRGLWKKRKETLEDFLTKFFNEWNEDKTTIYAGNSHLQTEPGKRRSFGDIYQICRYYYPGCTVKQVSDIIYRHLPTTVPRFRSSYCNMINKRVFYKGSEGQVNQFFDTSKHDEYGMTPAQWRNL
jgi:hypothetical protein